jgi:hypothetical protein
MRDGLPRLCFDDPAAICDDDPPGDSATGLMDKALEVARLRGGSSLSVRLSAKGLFNVRAESPDAKFAFIVAGRRHECSWGAAEFVSPRVSDLHSFDATIDELIIDVDDPENFFDEFVAAASGGCVTMSPPNCEVFLSICAALDNRELSRQLSPTITVSNAVDRIRLGVDISAEVAFIASHFYEFAAGVDELPLPIISEIISHPSLALDSEDSLYDFVRNRDLELLEYVRMEYCRPGTI